MSNDSICEIEGTVATGFEQIAKEEVAEKFSVEGTCGRGKINFFLPINDVAKVLQLCTVDNLYVVISHHENYVFAETLEEVLKQFEGLVPQGDWETGLRVWEQFHDFPHRVSAHPVASANPEEAGSGDHATPTLQPACDSSASQETDNDKTTTAPPSETNTTMASGDKDKSDDDQGSDSVCVNSEPSAKIERKIINEGMPSFRATCYRSGGKHIFQSPQAACAFGGAVQDYFGWNVNLSNYDIEVVVTIESNHVYLSVALTKGSLHKRNITHFGPTTLRPTLAHGILRLCSIQPGEVVCDPMCGGGSIPIEAAINWPKAHHICGDIFEQAVVRTRSNIDCVNEKRISAGRKLIDIDVFRWDTCQLPLPDNSVDVFVTDMPFGKRSGSKLKNWQLYPRVLGEMARVCKMETGRACLLTQDKRCINKILQQFYPLWRRTKTLWINIGGLSAGVYLLHRTTVASQTNSGKASEATGSSSPLP